MSEVNERAIEQCKPTKHFCTTYLKQTSASIEWTITNFNLLQIDSNSLESSSFESVTEDVHTGTWKLKLFHKYNNEDKVGLFFACSENLAKSIFVKCRACIIDSEGKEANKKEVGTQLTSRDIGFSEFITKSDLVESLLPNGNLTIRCSVTVTYTNQTQFKRNDDEEFAHGCLLRHDFSKLLKEELLSDVVLLCDGRKFPVHKCILSARSSVFSEMFTRNLTVEQENIAKITDIESEVLQSLLFYIYTDKLPVFLTTKTVINLLQGGHDYKLQGLKAICEVYLKKAVSLPYIYEIAVAVEAHSLESLKEICIDFVYAHINEIMLAEINKDFFFIAPPYLLRGVLNHHFMKGSKVSQLTHILTSMSTSLNALPRRKVKSKRRVYPNDSINAMET